MGAPKISEAEFIELFESVGAHALARQLRINPRNVYSRRRNLEKKLGRSIVAPDDRQHLKYAFLDKYPGRLEYDLENGVILVGSDAHYWPGEASVAHRAFVKFCKEEKPDIVFMNGDVIDGATVSRHAPIGWENRPTLIKEIETAQERLLEIRTALPRTSRTIWLLGNHDARLETRIATLLPELAKLRGVHLRDHFGEEWECGWSSHINDKVVIKHRFRGGIHATHNNVMWAGKTMVTGHLHSLQVRPFSDYNGTRYGVDTGCLANVYARSFHYLEDNPRNWRSGFAVLTFKDGRLLWPETVAVVDEEHVDFRGKVIKV
jgi:hypothetical protein